MCSFLIQSGMFFFILLSLVPFDTRQFRVAYLNYRTSLIIMLITVTLWLVLTYILILKGIRVTITATAATFILTIVRCLQEFIDLC